ncbi:hypothetical protein QQP08_025793 [Theobroma cacao]|nr:hypothetical protein QQP08_025793 [Theobroma cacao]
MEERQSQNYKLTTKLITTIPLHLFTIHLQEETFSSVKQLFNIPLETKKKHINPKAYHGHYEPGLLFFSYESFGLEDASNCNSVKSFADFMWPNGHDHFW